MKQYNVVQDELNNCQIIWYEENGIRYSFTDKDPANSDYQAYLRHLAGEDEAQSL